MSKSSTAKNIFNGHTSAEGYGSIRFTAFPLKLHHQIVPTQTLPDKMGADPQDKPGNWRELEQKS